MARHDRNPRGGARKTHNKYQSTDKKQRQIENRDRAGRRRDALDAVAEERRALEERLAWEAEHPLEGRVAGADFPILPAKPEPPPPKPPEVAPQQTVRRRRQPLPVPPDATGKDGWTMGQARSLVRQGYHIIKVMEMTGWGMNAFDDMKIDADGYGMPIA